jgi:putative flippase GtrA
VIGVTGMVITNAVYDLLSARLGIGPVTATTIATIAAAIATYLGNRSWSFRTRQRTGVVREIIIFAVLNGIGPLIQDATVAFNSCLLGLGHGKLAGLIALSSGIALATLFRFGPIGGSSGSPGHRRECQAARTGLGSVCGSFTPVRSRSPAVGQRSSAHVTDGPGRR